MRAPLSPSSPRRGAALLLVLGILVLICALVLSFFSSVNTELTASQSYANGATVKQLSDSAVQVAISQVVAGTQGTANGAALAWASQPGMIRTYDASGNPGQFYKLYSAPKMVVDGTGFSPASETPPTDWDSAANSGLFTDLNSPVTRNGTVYFPILDPRALSATASQSVEGFSYQTGTDGVVAPGGAADSQRLPMPVRWLYVLQNGKLAVPSTASGGKVSFDATDPTAAPTAANPIVGRIAFWTDDETCKININTASEGTFWDRPWMNTATEQKFSTAIPVQNEFQRYPGHPATTCLSPVLGPLLPSSVLLKTQVPAQLKAYYDLVPRIADGGTLGGTVDDSAASAITPDGDRLYASPDELLYASSRAVNPTLTNAATAPNVFLEKAKFFLTAHSRAPETNLYGLPRVALWPLMAGAGLRNAKDKLIAFCSTIGGNAYYFQRQAAYGGPASMGSSQSATLDWTGVKRNQDLYTYLDALTSKAVPGFGASFAAKYPSTRKQILTEMVDMIRGGVNTYSTALAPSYNYAPQLGDTGEGQVIPLHPGNGTQGFGRYATVTSAALVFFRSNVAPYTVAGSPPVATVTTAAQIRCALILNPFTPSPGLPTWSPNLQYVVSGLDKFSITTAGGGATSLGFPAQVANTTTARIGFSGGGNAMPFFGVQAQFRYASDSGLGLAGKDGTKTTGTDPKLNYPLVSPASAPSGLGDTTFDFAGNTITVTIYAGADTTLANPLQTIQLPFDGIKGLPIPTTNPAGTDYTYFSRFAESAGNTISKPYRTRLFESGTAALPLPAPASGTVSYTYQDVVRGVEPDPAGPAKGDLRVYAALAAVPASYFRHSPGYDQLVGGVQQYHFTQSLRDEGFLTGGPQFGYDDKAGGVDPHWDFTPDTSVNSVNNLTFIQSNSGFLVDKQYLASYGGSPAYGTVGQPQYRGAACPAVPRGLASALDASGNPGDWDNMTGITEDGPYINKPDEGNGATTSALKNVSYMSFTLSGGYFSYGLDLQNLGGDYRADNGQTFSPNRQVASAVLFGSLPTGIDPGNAATVRPWQTLLFCANPAAGTGHFGFGIGQGGTGPAALAPFTTLPDWLFLDLFTMPVVEPYAISEPLSTAGKVNMNYPIVPFSYITRDTAVRGVLKASRLLAIPSAASTVSGGVPSYKDGSGTGYPYECRYGINPAESGGTLEGFERRFNPSKFGLAGNPDLFRSAAEICSVYLVPQKISGATYTPGVVEPTYTTAGTWWTTGGPGGTGFRLTGDNSREIPYGDLYPRLTTKSNTYTVHLRVQTLKKVPTTSATQWVEGTDQTTGEYRGSALFERYVDASDTTLPDFAAANAPSVDGYYKVRIVSAKKFSP